MSRPEPAAGAADTHAGLAAAVGVSRRRRPDRGSPPQTRVEFVERGLRHGNAQINGGARRRPSDRQVAAGSLVAVVLDVAGVGDVPRRVGWEDSAACAGVNPDVFFPWQGGSVRPAVWVCSACPVRRDCLRFAIENGELYGVWGGLSEDQRRGLRRRARQLLKDGRRG